MTENEKAEEAKPLEVVWVALYSVLVLMLMMLCVDVAARQAEYRAPPHPRAERNPSPFPCLKAKVKKLGRRITVGENKPMTCEQSTCHQRGTERQHHLNRQASPQRHRRTHHAAPRLWHVAIVPGDDRMHLRLGQEIRPPASTNSRAESIAGSGPGRSLQRLPHVDDGGVVRCSRRTLMRD